MATRVRLLRGGRPGQGILLTFVAAVLLPGVLLAAFGVRAFVLERRAVDQEVRARLDRAAGIAANAVERALADWTTAVERVALDPAQTVAAWPASLGTFAADEDVGVIVVLARAKPSVWPARRLLYQPAPDEAPTVPRSPRLAEAEVLELQRKDYDRAAAAYERLLVGAPAGQQALYVHRLARTHRKAGRSDEATRLLRRLERLEDPVAGVPADLIARYEIAAALSSVGQRTELATAAHALSAISSRAAGRWTSRATSTTRRRRAPGWQAMTERVRRR
jgi:tetratricopeptide (TPR) repeat protein